MEQGAVQKTDKEILGYSRYVVLIAAFFAMFIISPYEYAWSSMSGPIGDIYGWNSVTQIGLMFTLFVVFESIGTLPGGILRDKYGARPVTIIGGILGGVGIFATSLGASLGFEATLVLWVIGSFFAGFVYNSAVNVANKWFPDKRGITAGLIAGAFSWGSLPFIFPIRAIPTTAPPSTFFHVIYIMAAIIGVVSVVAGIFMKDPPGAWAPPGWKPSVKAIKRPSEHEYTFKEALSTWQMWVLVVSFILISSAGLAAVSKMVGFSKSYGFVAAAATSAAGGISISNGLGRLGMGSISERLGRENSMIISYILTGVFLFLSTVAGSMGNDPLFLVFVILAIFFWGPLFALFPTTIGHYYGSKAAGGNYGLLYAIAKGSGGVYGGILSAALIGSPATVGGYTLAMGVGGAMAIVAGLLIIPLKFKPPVWHEEKAPKATGAPGR